MTDPTAVIVRFKGDADDLSERFEKARQLWIGAQDGDYSPPAFYALCKTDDGIVILDGWHTDADHEAFGRAMEPHLAAAGLGGPDHLEHMSIDRLGWD